MNKDLEMARILAERVAEAGGCAYFVGGFVRDRLMGFACKDIDIEVHGISVQQLEEILRSLGELTVMGASFGILGLKHYDLDIAMPRSEVAHGRGHKDFDVFVDPFIGPEKAAARRDFTINALMQNILTEEVLDFYGGLEDLRRGCIRHVRSSSFVEDPLRVFRAAQFAARFGFVIADDTVELCRTMDLEALSCERVMGETEKALMKAERPSLYFEALRRMNALNFWFPEMESLIGQPQDPYFHPEGSVWTHTMQVIDLAAEFRKEAVEPKAIMFAAAAHDLGKAVSCQLDGDRVHAYGHEQSGLSLAERMMSRLTSEVQLRKYVLNMVELHMEPNKKIRMNAKKKSFMKMFDTSVCPEDLLILAKADMLGRSDSPERSEALRREYAPMELQLKGLLDDYRELMKQPRVMGRDLIQAGVQPGPILGQALEYAHKLHLAGVPKAEALNQTLGIARKLRSK